jgi:hypothetical protein
LGSNFGQLKSIIMKKLVCILLVALPGFFIACRNETPKNPDGTPRVENGKDVKLGTDEYDQNSVRDTVSAERGTTNKDSSSGLGGNR